MNIVDRSIRENINAGRQIRISGMTFFLNPVTNYCIVYVYAYVQLIRITMFKPNLRENQVKPVKPKLVSSDSEGINVNEKK